MSSIKPFSDCLNTDEFFAQFEYKPQLGSASSVSTTLLRPRDSFVTYSKPLKRRKIAEEKRKKTKKKVIEKKKKSKVLILTAAQRRSEPYRRFDLESDRRWVPPFSYHNLIQEIYCDDPWKVLVVCLLCNRTRGSQANKVIAKLFQLYPSTQKTLQVDVSEIEKTIAVLGLQRKRSKSIKRLSVEYLQDWEYVTQLHTVGKYAADAYAIFCSGHWRDVTPVDHKLVNYWKYLHCTLDHK